MPTLEAPPALGRDERECIDLGRREALGHQLCGLGGEAPQTALLPGVDEPAGCRVVPDRRPGAREAEPAARALAAAFDRPRGRRAAARAERRLDPLELVAAAGAELFPAAAAYDAALRQDEVEHPPTLGRDVSRERVGSVEAV